MFRITSLFIIGLNAKGIQHINSTLNNLPLYSTANILERRDKDALRPDVGDLLSRRFNYEKRRGFIVLDWHQCKLVFINSLTQCYFSRDDATT